MFVGRRLGSEICIGAMMVGFFGRVGLAVFSTLFVGFEDALGSIEGILGQTDDALGDAIGARS